MKPVSDILTENEKRKNLYFRDYSRQHGDPLGETIQRRGIIIDGSPVYLPESMFVIPLVQALEKYGSFSDILLATKGTISPEEEKKLIGGFHRDRFKHDFEFWAIICVKIEDKLDKLPIPFKLNSGQRKLLASFERQRKAGIPIRTILVKARQWGGSTLTQMYMLWLQLYHYVNWHSLTVSALQDQSVNMREMVANALDWMPTEIGVFTLTAVTGSQTSRKIVERGCKVHIGSYEKPNKIRSFSIAMAHLTEISSWIETRTKSGQKLAQALYAAIPNNKAGTFIMVESTANGVGDFFHEQWLVATSGTKEKMGSQYEPVFVSWFEIEMYTAPIEDYTKVIQSMTEYDWWQWKQGATLEGINWYRLYKHAMNYSDIQMKSEFPITAAEAFQGTSSNYFTDEAVEQARASCREPIWIGGIRGDAPKGREALKGITLFERDTGGSELLKVWEMPEASTEEKVLYQYLVIVDIGGKHYKSDNSVISVFDRAALMSPFGAMERVAIWVGHVDHDILAWKAAQIAEFYNHALLVIEKNTLVNNRSRSDTVLYEGDHVYTVIDELAEDYDNLYAYVSAPDKVIDNGRPLTYGWSMNKKSKYQAYDRYTAALRDHEYIERSHDAVNEMQWLQIKPSGQIEAAAGKRDDIQDTTAIGVYVGFNEMPLPKIVQIHNAPANTLRQKKSVGAAQF